VVLQHLDFFSTCDEFPGCSALYYYPSVSSRAATIWSVHLQQSRARQQAIFGCGYAALYYNI
jgi:hypothetical protein